MIAYRTAGDGPIDLVFSVGVSNCEALWDHPASARFLDRLASFSRLVVFDFRGSGASDGLPSSGFPTWEDWTDDVRVVLEDLGSQRCAFFVVGPATPSAIVFATTYPERTTALIVYQAPLGRPDPTLVEAVREYIRSGWGSVDFVRGIAPSMADDERYIEWAAKTQRLSSTPRLAAAQIAHYASFDATDLLGLIHSPTLVLHRPSPLTQDPHEWISRISDARLIELDVGDELLFGTAGSDQVVDHVEEFLTGVRPTPTPDRVLATVLFTDIVGSTDRAAALGDQQWRSLLDAHDECVREQIEYFRGRLVKTTGDGVFATFDGPGRGIQCARALRRSLADLDVEIRAGLHTGEVEIRGGDIGGIAVHIGARIAAMASTGEVLVSSTVKDLVVGSDLSFSDRGLHALKGIPDEWRLFCVTE